MADEPIYLTVEKVEEFRKELEHLMAVRRKEIAEGLEAAVALGDLKENTEYHSLRKEKVELENRIAELEHMLKVAVVIAKKDAGGSDGVVELGSEIVVEKAGSDKHQALTLVGAQEADIVSDKISNESPLGSALLGGRKGDKVVVKSPSGDVTYTIISVS